MGYMSADKKKYCVHTPVLVVDMAHPEGRIFLSVVIYSGKL